jgi:hypothetical protein
MEQTNMSMARKQEGDDWIHSERKQVRFILPFPDPNEPESQDSDWRTRKGNARNDAYEAEIRRRWRALALSIRKFEAVATGMVFFEEEFLPYFVLPMHDGC